VIFFDALQKAYPELVPVLVLERAVALGVAVWVFSGDQGVSILGKLLWQLERATKLVLAPREFVLTPGFGSLLSNFDPGVFSIINLGVIAVLLYQLLQLIFCDLEVIG
jgi:hypothetical protein